MLLTNEPSSYPGVNLLLKSHKFIGEVWHCFLCGLVLETWQRHQREWRNDRHCRNDRHTYRKAGSGGLSQTHRSWQIFSWARGRFCQFPLAWPMKRSADSYESETLILNNNKHLFSASLAPCAFTHGFLCSPESGSVSLSILVCATYFCWPLGIE